ncbi:hypothetical protein QJS10_CPA01g00002 [Acorus calamus]|uniref:RNase H type-1 domain-containing protein n=1 Tax=Acorus calamus TaxID=4465 RepID=A0AAV9FGJ9_ACOCL|nr:hypothetical protein QJS10_CPA01g00002 [Acorus calamus]
MDEQSKQFSDGWFIFGDPRFQPLLDGHQSTPQWLPLGQAGSLGYMDHQTTNLHAMLIVDSRLTGSFFLVSRAIWEPSYPPWVKLNVDGASHGNPGPSGAGGVFRDHQATFLLGFSCNTSHNTNTFAEFYGLFRGIAIWFETHPHFQGSIWIESDSTLVVNTIKGLVSANTQVQPFVLHTLKLLDLLREWKITHIFREGNMSADKLASLGLGLPSETIFDRPPTALAHFLNEDANEVPQFRFPKS